MPRRMLTFAAGISLIAALLVGCAQGSMIQGSGAIKTETRQISNIDSVEFNTSGLLTIQQGRNQLLVIEADDNILPLLDIKAQGSRLIIGAKPGSSFTISTLKFNLTVRGLSSLTLNGSGDAQAASLANSDFAAATNGSGNLTIDVLEVENLSLSLSGSGDVQIKALTARHITANLAGSGNATLEGTTDSQSITVAGMGGYNAEKLQSKSATASTQGSGSITIAVSDTLDASVSGSGSVIYAGNPTVTEKDSGSGSITRRS